MTGVQTCALPIYLRPICLQRTGLRYWSGACNSIGAHGDGNTGITNDCCSRRHTKSTHWIAVTDTNSSIKRQDVTAGCDRAKARYLLKAQRAIVKGLAANILSQRIDDVSIGIKICRAGIAAFSRAIDPLADIADALPLWSADASQIKCCGKFKLQDRKSTRLNSSHIPLSRMPSSA